MKTSAENLLQEVGSHQSSPGPETYEDYTRAIPAEFKKMAKATNEANIAAGKVKLALEELTGYTNHQLPSLIQNLVVKSLRVEVEKITTPIADDFSKRVTVELKKLETAGEKLRTNARSWKTYISHALTGLTCAILFSGFLYWGWFYQSETKRLFDLGKQTDQAFQSMSPAQKEAFKKLLFQQN